ncbi:hypothetical protein C0993_012758 [Termitomyces sp. T159_Od127]|nr:hypothetical protein C0993_012758 [Termitomyces sp. T159_Od127]
MISSPSTVLPQGVGYGIVIGWSIGLFFSVLMIGLTALQSRYTPYKPSNSEEFSSASRSIKLGLVASGIVSAWTTAATLVNSNLVLWLTSMEYLVRGGTESGLQFKFSFLLKYVRKWTPMHPIQVSVQLAAKLKLNAPNAHTWLEIVGERWGTLAHSVFLFFGLATNIINSSLIILGGSATVTDLTGMSTIAGSFSFNPFPVKLSPTPVSTHTTVLLCIILTFIFTVYTTSPKIGSISAMHKLLLTASEIAPVPGNAGGSYLTMRSKNGLIFGVINIIGNFATVFNDQAYWQRAIASRPASCVKAYLLGGIAWFAIPFTFSTTVGLAAIALRGDPDMRTLTFADVSAGLPAPAAVTALLGPGGAVVMLILLFLAVTSATSAELIAVSSILTYDVYKRYVNSHATESQILRISHYMHMISQKVSTYALMMSTAGLIFFYLGVSMGWLYTFMGVVLGSAVIPTALCVSWSKANKWGCIVGAIGGFFAGIISWLVATVCLNEGIVNVETTGGDLEMLAGNLASISVGGMISVIWSMVYPANFDFSITRSINAPHNHGHVSSFTRNQEQGKKNIHSDEIETISNVSGLTADCDLDPIELNKAFKFAACSSIALVIYGVHGLKAWVVIGIIWLFSSCFAVVLYPLWESRQALGMVFSGVMKRLWFAIVESQDLFHGRADTNKAQREKTLV